MTCTYEYVTDEWNPRSFILFAFVFSYCLPLIVLTVYYSRILGAAYSSDSALSRAKVKLANEVQVSQEEEQKVGFL